MERSLVYALETVGDSSVSLRPVQKACRECVFDGKDAFVWLPTGSGKFICLLDKKLGRDNSLVVVVHRYLQQLPPPFLFPSPEKSLGTSP